MPRYFIVYRHFAFYIEFDAVLSIEPIKFIDLFAGIGGFRLGFEQAGYDCVFSCEINERCRDVYQANFNDMPYFDITTLEPENLPDFEILTAGFPCQPFSICGKKMGFEDTRGTLFFDICRIIKAKQPKVIVLENVKHLIHHDKGNTLKVILETLEDLGYFISYQLLNAINFGVPQNRERIIIICTKSKKFNFSKLSSKPTPKLKDFLDTNGEFEFVNSDEYTLIDSPKIQDSGLLFVGYRNKGMWKTGVRPNTEHLSRVHRQPNRIYSIDGVHPTLPSQETSGRFFIYLPEENKVRKMTITECYRIMGFPENFVRHESLAECYKQVGNSVCIPMIQEIAHQIQLQGHLNNAAKLQTKSQRFIQEVLF